MVLSGAFPDAPWAESLVRGSAAGVKLEIRRHVIYKETTESTFRKLKTHAQSNSDSFFLGPAISFRVPLGLCSWRREVTDPLVLRSIRVADKNLRRLLSKTLKTLIVTHHTGFSECSVLFIVH